MRYDGAKRVISTESKTTVCQSCNLSLGAFVPGVQGLQSSRAKDDEITIAERRQAEVSSRSDITYTFMNKTEMQGLRFSLFAGLLCLLLWTS